MDRKYLLQGADSVIFERLADGTSDIKKTTRDHLEKFGAAGLRTLCLAYTDISSDAYTNWNEKFIQAKTSLHDREKKLDEVSFGFEQIVLVSLESLLVSLSSVLYYRYHNVKSINSKVFLFPFFWLLMEHGWW